MSLNNSQIKAKIANNPAFSDRTQSSDSKTVANDYEACSAPQVDANKENGYHSNGIQT